MSSLNQKIIKNKREKRILKKKKIDDENKKIDGVIDSNIDVAIKLWNNIKKKVTEDPTFVKMSDTDKISLYQKSEFTNFYTEFPIVSRYMICMGQFSVNAFKKYLLKCKNVEHDSIKSKERGYSEDQWIQRQSDYVRYLWESYQKINFSKIESDDIWKNTYEILKQEFKDFKDLHKNIEDKLDKEKITNKEEMVKELLSRLANNEQSLDDTTTKNLIASLQEKVAQNKKH